MFNRIFRTGAMWGSLPFTTQYTEAPAPDGSTSYAGQTSTTWEQANPSMAPDMFVPVSTGEGMIYDDEGEGSEGYIAARGKVLGLTPKQWLVVGLVLLLLRK